MAKKQFKAESKRLLDLMINSIYTHKEIFLREIISNASDAIDKLCYLSLTDDKVGLDRGDFKIEITVDKDARTLTVSDNGIGMDKDELENNLGVIASSGSYKFRQEAEQKEDIDIIGQFGVGFYSAFMVADEITVVTKKYGAETAYRWQSSGADGYTVAECEKDSVGTDVIMHLKADTDEEKYSEYRQEAEQKEDIDIIGQFGVGFYSAFMVADEITVVTKKYGAETAYRWQSSGADGYTVAECEKDSVGTDVIMHLKADTDEEKYSEYLDGYRLYELVKKYSDYIRYPIRMLRPTRRVKAGSDPEKPEYEYVDEMTTVNSMVPLWQRPRGEVTDEEYEKFYQSIAHAFDKPQRVITASVEGAVTYKALLFIPSQRPMDFYSEGYEKGLQLYSAGVMIMDHCDALLPDYLRFVRGVVDSPDLSLNISRELLQHDRQLKVIGNSLEKKLRADLEKLLRDDREGYEKFYENFGRAIGFGIAGPDGLSRKEALQDLLLFYSSTEKKLVTLREYVDRMPESQKYIYYAAGENVSAIDHLPQTELLKDKNYEILYLTGETDEFVLQMLGKYADKEFRSIVDGELDLGDEEEKVLDEKPELMQFVKETLGDKIKEARASRRLKTHPVCMTAGEGLSFEMEKYFKNFQMPTPVKADRILELNTDHPAVQAMEAAMTSDRAKAELYAKILYDQALLIAGLPLEDPSEYTDLVAELMK